MKIPTTTLVVCHGLVGCAGVAWEPDETSGYPFDERGARVVMYQLGDETCRLEATLPPAGADRQLEVVGEMYGDYAAESSLGTLVVMVGGRQVIGSRSTKGENTSPDGRMVAENRHWIRGNETVRVIAEGAVRGGRCTDLRVRVRDSVAQTATAE